MTGKVDNEKKLPLLSIVITSYTMERFRDICDLFDTIKNENQRMCRRGQGIKKDNERFGRRPYLSCNQRLPAKEEEK